MKTHTLSECKNYNNRYLFSFIAKNARISCIKIKKMLLLVSEITGSEVKKRVDTLAIISKQRCARCGRVHMWIGIRRIFLVRVRTADFSLTKSC